MEKNMMMLLVVAVVVVVVIIAAVLLMGGGGGGGGVPIGGQDLANAISQGKPVECDMTLDLSKAGAGGMMEGVEGTMSGKIRMENPKISMVASMMFEAGGMNMDVDMEMRSDGVNAYMLMDGIPGMSGEWLKVSSGQTAGMPTDPDEIARSLEQRPEGMTLECRLVGDIPDSEFQLPPGVTAREMTGFGF